MSITYIKCLATNQKVGSAGSLMLHQKKSKAHALLYIL